VKRDAMSESPVQKQSYLALGFLDFLAYYVPGLLTILFLFVVSIAYDLDAGNPVAYVDQAKDEYVRGATWTVLALVVPYVMGHLIFPAGYFLAKWSRLPRVPFVGKLRLWREWHGFLAIPDSSDAPSCPFLLRSEFCKPDSFAFARCVLFCFRGSTSGFNELMITRFRTLSRFCRSMLFPTLLLTTSLFMIAGRTFGLGHYSEAIGLSVTALLVTLSFFGFGARYRSYERRWRHAVCVASRAADNAPTNEPQALTTDRSEPAQPAAHPDR
jgi:hypothetical protein